MHGATSEATKFAVLLRNPPPPPPGRKPSPDPKPGKPEPEGGTPKELKNPEGTHPLEPDHTRGDRCRTPCTNTRPGCSAGSWWQRMQGQRGGSLSTGSLSAVASRQVQHPSPLNPQTLNPQSPETPQPSPPNPNTVSLVLIRKWGNWAFGRLFGGKVFPLTSGYEGAQGGLTLWVWGLGSRVQGLGFRLQGP